MTATTRLHPRKQPRQNRAQATVEAILRATAHILVEEGYESLTTNKTAQRAGVSIGSLYQYFPNKEALVAALIDEHSAQCMQLLGQTVAELGVASPERAVRVFVKALLSTHAVEPELHRVLSEQLPRIDGFNKIRELSNQAAILVRTYLEEHKDRLRVKNLDMAANIVVYAVEAATHGAILDGSLHDHVDELANEISDMVVRYLLKDVQ